MLSFSIFLILFFSNQVKSFCTHSVLKSSSKCTNYDYNTLFSSTTTDSSAGSSSRNVKKFIVVTGGVISGIGKGKS